MNANQNIQLDGEWKEAVHGYKFRLNATLTVNGTDVTGRIDWKLLAASPNTPIYYRLNKPRLDHGYENVAGTLTGKRLQLTGTKVYPMTLLSNMSYDLDINTVAKTFTGTSQPNKFNGPGTMQGTIV